MIVSHLILILAPLGRLTMRLRCVHNSPHLFRYTPLVSGYQVIVETGLSLRARLEVLIGLYRKLIQSVKFYYVYSARSSGYAGTLLKTNRNSMWR